MSEYSVRTCILNEAGEDFLLLAREFKMLLERVSSVLSSYPESPAGFRQQLDRTKESMNGISRKTRDLGLTLYEIIDCYAYAERRAIGGDNRYLHPHTANPRDVKLPSIRNTSGAVMFDRTILPDWLQMAVLEYEQSLN